jgi:hypothetical protein
MLDTVQGRCLISTAISNIPSSIGEEKRGPHQQQSNVYTLVRHCVQPSIRVVDGSLSTPIHRDHPPYSCTTSVEVVAEK